MKNNFTMFLLLVLGGLSLLALLQIKNAEELTEVPDQNLEQDQEMISLYAKGKTDDGLNLIAYRSREEGLDFEELHLKGMDGEIIHTWKTDFDYPEPRKEESTDEDHILGRLLPDGDIIILTPRKGIARLDWESNVVWHLKGDYHHEVQVVGDYIYTLLHETRYLDYKNQTVPIIDDVVVKMDHDGNLLETKSLYDVFKDIVPANMYEKIIAYMRDEGVYDEIQSKPDQYFFTYNKPWDIFHTNSLQVLGDSSPIFSEGQILVSFRTLSTVAIYEPETDEIIWTYAGEMIHQHNPTLLDNGNLLIYDNGSDSMEEGEGILVDEVFVDGELRLRGLSQRLYSRIIELNPATKEIEWKYVGQPRDSFYSRVMGSVQRLSNKNTLFVDAVGGKIYEVTLEGEIVWKYNSPVESMILYRAYRLTDEEEGYIKNFLKLE